MQQLAGIIDVPDGDEDTATLAAEMSDEEFRSLVIIMFRWMRTDHEFLVTLRELFDGMMSNPAMALGMMGAVNGGGSQVDRLKAAGLVPPGQ